MILIGLGANKAGPWGDALQTLNTAIATLGQVDINIEEKSTFLISEPLGKMTQQRYVNAVVAVKTHLPPMALLLRIHQVEKRGGRSRGRRWAPRTLDLDLLDWHGVVRNWPPQNPPGGQGAPGHIPLTLPHPGIACRPFVLAPIAEIAPKWRHPVLKRSAAELLTRLKTIRGGQIVRRL